MTIQSLLQAQDTSVVILFGGVASFVLNWYGWTGQRARRIMTWVPLLAVLAVIVVEVLQ